MSYYEMALDAGYRGEEARQFAECLEMQDYEEYVKYLRDQEEYSIEDECDYRGHQMYGVDIKAPVGEQGRCYCGKISYDERSQEEE